MSSFYGNGGYSSEGSGEVISINGKKGRVTLDAADVHALPDSTQIPSLEGFATEAWVNNQDFLTSGDISGKADKSELPMPPLVIDLEDITVPSQIITALEQNRDVIVNALYNFDGIDFNLTFTNWNRVKDVYYEGQATDLVISQTLVNTNYYCYLFEMMGGTLNSEQVPFHIINRQIITRESLEDALNPMQAAIQAKADSSVVTALTTSVAGKANTSDVTALDARVTAVEGDILELQDGEYKIVVVSSAERAMCTALVDNTGNAILFDLSDEMNGLKVVSDLNDAGVTNVVAVVISHYHHDHLGDYTTIFGSNGLSYDNVQFFVPDAPVLSFTSQKFIQIYNDFIEWLETKSIAYRTPTENESVNIKGVKLTFNNVDTSYWYNNYTPETFNYNWTSMCTYVEFASASMQCMGDLYTDGLDYFTDVLNATRKATILNAVHHGLTAYINDKFMESCSPNVVINNYGTDNSYLNEKNYSTLIANYCNKVGIPVFDTSDNDTFEIYISNGSLEYKGLTPVILNGEIITYPSYRDALRFDNTGISVGQNLGIKELLKGMRPNSSIKCRLGSAYQIYEDLIGSFGNYAVFEVSKFIGGSSNYLINRTYANDFWFEIKVTPFFEIVSETLNYFGYYDSINDAFHISKNKTVPMAFARMNLTKSVETDTIYSLSNASGTYQIGDLIHIDTNSFTVDRTGIYEVTVTGNNVGTNDSITLDGWKYNIDNGESASFTQPLSSGTPYQFGSTNSTSKRSMFATIKFLGSNIQPLFPE